MYKPYEQTSLKKVQYNHRRQFNSINNTVVHEEDTKQMTKTKRDLVTTIILLDARSCF